MNLKQALRRMWMPRVLPDDCAAAALTRIVWALEARDDDSTGALRLDSPLTIRPRGADGPVSVEVADFDQVRLWSRALALGPIKRVELTSGCWRWQTTGRIANGLVRVWCLSGNQAARANWGRHRAQH